MHVPVQIFSERCSGSNHLASFIAKNFPEISIGAHFGLKHWIPYKKSIENRDRVFVLILARSPFDWLRSIHRKPWHAAFHLRELDFSNFIRAEWSCIWDTDAGIDRNHRLWNQEMNLERHPQTGERFKNILEMRSIKHKVWLDVAAETPLHYLACYEDLVKDYAGFSHNLAERANISTPKQIIIPPGYKAKMSWKRKLLFRASFGLVGGYQPKPPTPLSEADIEFIANALDPDIEAALGYDINALARHELQLCTQHS